MDINDFLDPFRVTTGPGSLCDIKEVSLFADSSMTVDWTFPEKVKFDTSVEKVRGA